MILTAGLGTRFKPLTNNIPKPLIEIIDRPMIDYSIKQLKKNNINELILNIHHKKELILDYFKNNNRYHDIKIKFSSEEELLGTSGGVKKVESFFDEEPFIVINSDMMFKIDVTKLLKFHKEKKADVTLCLTEKGKKEKFGSLGVAEDSRIIRYLDTSISNDEKHRCIFKGIHIISPRVLNEIPGNIFQDFSRHTYPDLLKKGYKIYGYISDEFWQPVGDLEEYHTFCLDLLDKRIPFEIPYRVTGEGIYLSPSAKIDSLAKLYPPVIISDNTFISANCSIGANSIIGPNCKVESNVTIENSILFSNVYIEEGTQLKNKICTPNIKFDF